MRLIVSVFLLLPLLSSTLSIPILDEQIVVSVPRSKGDSDSGSHPKEWIEGPDDRLYQFHSGEQNWLSAREYCRARKADLVAIKSKDQLDWLLKQYEPTYPEFSERLVQIGLFQSDKEEWIWADKTPLDNTLLNWTSGEPFDHAHGREKCAVLRVTGRLLDDMDCEETDRHYSTMRFVCERTMQQHVQQQKSNNFIWSKLEALFSYFGIGAAKKEEMVKNGEENYWDLVEKETPSEMTSLDKFELAEIRLNETEDSEEDRQVAAVLDRLSKVPSVLREPNQNETDEFIPNAKAAGETLHLISPVAVLKELDEREGSGVEVEQNEITNENVLEIENPEKLEKVIETMERMIADMESIHVKETVKNEKKEEEKEKKHDKKEKIEKEKNNGKKVKKEASKEETAENEKENVTDSDKTNKTTAEQSGEEKEDKNKNEKEINKEKREEREEEKKVEKKEENEKIVKNEAASEDTTEDKSKDKSAQKGEGVKEVEEKKEKKEKKERKEKKEEEEEHKAKIEVKTEKTEKKKEEDKEEKKEGKEKVESETNEEEGEEGQGEELLEEEEENTKEEGDESLLSNEELTEEELEEKHGEKNEKKKRARAAGVKTNSISDDLEKDFEEDIEHEMPSTDIEPPTEEDCEEDEEGSGEDGEDLEKESSGESTEVEERHKEFGEAQKPKISKEREAEVVLFLTTLRKFLARAEHKDLRSLLKQESGRSLLERMQAAVAKANAREFTRLEQMFENGTNEAQMDFPSAMDEEEQEELYKKISGVVLVEAEKEGIIVPATEPATRTTAKTEKEVTTTEKSETAGKSGDAETEEVVEGDDSVKRKTEKKDDKKKEEKKEVAQKPDVKENEKKEKLDLLEKKRRKIAERKQEKLEKTKKQRDEKKKEAEKKLKTTENGEKPVAPAEEKSKEIKKPLPKKKGNGKSKLFPELEGIENDLEEEEPEQAAKIEIKKQRTEKERKEAEKERKEAEKERKAEQEKNQKEKEKEMEMAKNPLGLGLGLPTIKPLPALPSFESVLKDWGQQFKKLLTPPKPIN